jgi:hypothetical protein
MSFKYLLDNYRKLPFLAWPVTEAEGTFFRGVAQKHEYMISRQGNQGCLSVIRKGLWIRQGQWTDIRRFGKVKSGAEWSGSQKFGNHGEIRKASSLYTVLEPILNVVSSKIFYCSSLKYEFMFNYVLRLLIFHNENSCVVFIHTQIIAYHNFQIILL